MFFIRYINFGFIFALIFTSLLSHFPVQAEALPVGLNNQIASQNIITTDKKTVATNQLIISAKTKNPTNRITLQNLAPTLSIAKIRELDAGKIYKLVFNEDINPTLISYLETQNWIASVALNPIEKTQALVQDPYITSYPTSIINQNYYNLLDRIQPLVKSSPTIAVIDSAFDVSHIDLNPNLLEGIDFADGDMDVNLPSLYKTGTDNQNIPNRSLFHGSMVSGVIVASSNGAGGMGICPWCKVKPYKTSSDAEITTDALGNTVAPGLYQDSMIASIYNAISRGIKIINISAGSKVYSSVYQEVVNYARDQGVIIVASSGNENTNAPLWPASFDSVISVASINSNLVKSSYSNYGPQVDISIQVDGGLVAPVYRNNQGVDLWSLRALGTSFASPVVSGIIGLITSLYPNITAAQIRGVLTNATLLTDLNSANPTFVNQLGMGLNPESLVSKLSTMDIINLNPPIQIISSNLIYAPTRDNLPKYNTASAMTVSLNNIQTLGTSQPINWNCKLLVKDYYSLIWRQIGINQTYNQSSGCQAILQASDRTNTAYLNIKWQLNDPAQPNSASNQFEFEDLLVFDFNGVGKSE